MLNFSILARTILEALNPVTGYSDAEVFPSPDHCSVPVTRISILV